MPSSSAKPELTGDRRQVLAFRLRGHHLLTRLPKSELLSVAGIGLHDPVPGTAALSLNARLEGLSPQDVEQALRVDKSLVRLWSLRMAPFVVPTRDAALFTLAPRPDDTASRLYFIKGATPMLDRVGLGVDELVERARNAALEALDGRALIKKDLCFEIAELIERDLPSLRSAWHSPAPYMPGTSTGWALASFALRIVALDGLFCYVPPERAGGEARFALTDHWLGEFFPEADATAARRELLARYLRAYGPSTPAHFAEWAGISPEQAKRIWALLEGELVPVSLGKKTAWLHREDVPAFLAPGEPSGVRLLPAYDPYLAGRDRDAMVPDRRLHSEIWKSAGNPGVILIDGKIAATWRPKKEGKRLIVTPSFLGPFPPEAREAIETEAATLASFREANDVKVAWR